MELLPPIAAQKASKLTKHKDTRIDPWYWLQDLDDPEVKNYLERENTYTDKFFEKAGDLPEKLFQELKMRLQEDDVSVPIKDGSYWYLSEIKKDQQYPVYQRKYGSEDAEPEVLLDVNALAQGEKFFELGFCENSPDHKLLAYSVDLTGNESYTVFIKDLSTGQLLPERFENTSGSFEWANDSKGFYYCTLDNNFRPSRMYSHIIGTKPSKDPLLYNEKDQRFIISLEKSESNRFIYLCIDGNNMNEWHYVDATSVEKSVEKSAGKNPLTLIQKREREHEYEVSDHEDFFYIITNDTAPDYKIVKTPISTPQKKYWQEFIPYEKGCLRECFCIYKDYLAIQEKRLGIPSLRIFHFASKIFTDIPFEDKIFDVSLYGGREYATDLLRYSYQSLTCTPEIYDYNMQTGEKTLKKKHIVNESTFSKAFAESNYEQRRIFARSHDGTQVPISLVFHKKFPPHPDNHLVLRGYGAYGISSDPSFSSQDLSLLDRGITIATAHIRGGMDLGQDWYQQGKLLNKKNTFLDFCAAAETLSCEGYTSKGKIIASGGSAGGMLMGYCANARPDLFRAIIAHVPFVDILTTMLDESLPLTASEYNEWGNPEIKQYYDYIKSYSPYDNVKPQAYPAMFIVAGIADMRVTYWEPTKWVAKLRQNQKGSEPILLKMHWDSGHSGASGRYDYLREIALDLTFILQVLQIPFESKV